MGISFKEVSHKYNGQRKKEFINALNEINIDINSKDEFVAIVGKTGSGKSTLVQHMNALLLPTSGKVQIFDYELTANKKKNPKLGPIRKRVGFVFQFPEYQLFEETVIKDIMFGPLNFGFNKEEAVNSAKAVAKLLGIEELLDKSPFNLSGGQMRKVAIAGILAYNPDILVLDEPTRGLDPKTASEVMDIFAKIAKTEHKTIILISHDMNIVHKYANRVIGMDNGNIIYDGNEIDIFKDELYKKCHLRKPDVIELIDYLNERMNLGLGYSIKDADTLIMKLKEVAM